MSGVIEVVVNCPSCGNLNRAARRACLDCNGTRQDDEVRARASAETAEARAVSGESNSVCQYGGCEERATHVLAVRILSGRAVVVAPYCPLHTQEQRAAGAVFAAGPAIRDDLASIEGIR